MTMARSRQLTTPASVALIRPYPGAPSARATEERHPSRMLPMKVAFPDIARWTPAWLIRRPLGEKSGEASARQFVVQSAFA